MSGRVGQTKRLIRVNAANIRNNHLYLNGIGDFFPRDSLGSPSKRSGLGSPLRLDVAGFPEPILTDIPTDPETGRPRAFFRKRSWVGEFFRYHGIRDGDLVAVERKGDHHYSLTPEYSSPEFTVAEFFAGIGLVRLALERRGFRVVFANDIDPQKLKMYRDNFGDADFRLDDVHALKSGDLPTCDLYTASFPCNDLSIAGAMAGLNGSQSSAFWGLVRLLDARKKARPALLLIENVPGFLMSQQGRDFEEALLALNRLGYACDALTIDAVRFVPQSRPRLFVIGRLDAIGEYPFGLEPSPVRSQSLVDFIVAHPHIRWEIREIPSPPEARPPLRTVLEDLPASDPAWWNGERTDYFMGQLSDRHAKVAASMIRGRKYAYATAFRRVRKGRSMAELRSDGIAGCLRTPRGGSGRQILFRAGFGKRSVRLLTARECARLQGVPDSYVITVPLNQALFGFGDAVCVPVIEWIAEHCLRPLLTSLPSHRFPPTLFA